MFPELEVVLFRDVKIEPLYLKHSTEHTLEFTVPVMDMVVFISTVVTQGSSRHGEGQSCATRPTTATGKKEQ